MEAALGDLITGYNYFSNRDEIAVDYLIMGPGLAIGVSHKLRLTTWPPLQVKERTVLQQFLHTEITL